MRDLGASLLILAGLSQLLAVQGFSQPSIHRPSPHAIASPLFQSRPSLSSKGHKQSFIPNISSRNLRKKPFSFSSRRVQAYAFRLLHKVKRSLVIVTASLLVWFGAAGFQTPPSHASTASTKVTQSRNVLSASLEQIVDRYVRDHMFDDDVYEPVESIYREAMADKMRGTHPKALSEITSSILGQDGIKVEKTSTSNGMGDLLMSAVGFLQRKGLSESTAVIVLTGALVVAGPVAILLGAMMVGSQSKRQVQSVMKKRYGDTYTVDATIKVEDEVEAPDDDDDDDEDQDKGDDDEDDDDDDE